MINVSDAWKAEHGKALLDESFIEISYNITDPDAQGDATATDNGAIFLSDSSGTVSTAEKQITPYATLEQNLWLLDGSREVIPDSAPEAGGYISSQMSDESCAFEPYPTVTVSFSKVHEPPIPGVTVTWSAVYGEYATQFRISAYNGASLVAEKTVSGNKTVRSVLELGIESYDRIVIEIQKWCLPHHRARIDEIFIGINQIYGKTETVGFSHEQNTDPIGASAPTNKISFSIDNRDNKFDPNNESGLSKYLMERQEMKVRYGQRLPGGSIEYIPAGVFYLSEWDSPQNGLTASFTARDLIEFLQKTYIKGTYSPSGVSLFDLATGVLEDAGLPLNSDGTKKWVVDDSLRNITTTAPLPLAPLAECLQYIAQAARCVFRCDRSGTLRIEPAASDASDYALTAFNLYSRPEISLQKSLGAVETKVYSYFAGEQGRELFSGTVSVNGTKDIVITYSDNASSASATVTGGTLVSAVYYAGACVLTIAGTGSVDVTVKGTLLKSSASGHLITVGDGETQVVDNPLITSSALADDVGEWVKEWLGKRKIITMSEWRADPRLDAGDIISVANKFGTENVRVTSVKYDYSGAFKGSGEGRVI